jgi:hypothetical protein
MPCVYPAFQNMISFDTPEVIRRRHEEHKEWTGATDKDIQLVNLAPTRGLEARQNYKSTFQLHWQTYVGWKCYMRHTGCLASDPAEEKRLEWEAAQEALIKSQNDAQLEHLLGD